MGEESIPSRNSLTMQLLTLRSLWAVGSLSTVRLFRSIFYNSTETEQFKPCSWWARADCGFPVAMSWYKPLSGRDARKSTMAVLLMNNGAEARDLSFKLSEIPGMKAAGCTAYSVWEGKTLGKVGASGFSAKQVASRDSVFLTLSSCQ